MLLVYPTSNSPVNWRHYSKKNLAKIVNKLKRLTLLGKEGSVPQEAPICRQFNSVIIEGILPSLTDKRLSTAQPQDPDRLSTK